MNSFQNVGFVFGDSQGIVLLLGVLKVEQIII